MYLKKSSSLFLIIIISLFINVSGCIESETIQNTTQTNPIDENNPPMDGNITIVDLKDLQETIDEASDGSIILVRSGILDHTIYVNRTIELKGYDDMSSILEVNDSMVNPAFIIRNDSVHLSNITLISTFKEHMLDTPVSLTGIEIRSSDCIIDHLDISSFNIGIRTQGQQGNIIENTMIQNASIGIELWDADNNMVKNCTISSCEQFGVFIGFDATGNQVSYCLISHCDNGVRITKFAQDNFVIRNTFRSCRNPYYECCGATNNEYVLNIEE